MHWDRHVSYRASEAQWVMVTVAFLRIMKSLETHCTSLWSKAPLVHHKGRILGFLATAPSNRYPLLLTTLRQLGWSPLRRLLTHIFENRIWANTLRVLMPTEWFSFGGSQVRNQGINWKTEETNIIPTIVTVSLMGNGNSRRYWFHHVYPDLSFITFVACIPPRIFKTVARSFPAPRKWTRR